MALKNGKKKNGGEREREGNKEREDELEKAVPNIASYHCHFCRPRHCFFFLLFFFFLTERERMTGVTDDVTVLKESDTAKQIIGLYFIIHVKPIHAKTFSSPVWMHEMFYHDTH